MKTFYHAFVERRNFGDLLTAEGISRLHLKSSLEFEFLTPLSDGEVIALWTQDPRSNPRLPDILVCRDGLESDWTAWITTFAARIRPFSAYMRLLPAAEFKSLARQIRQPELGQLSWPVAGLVLGEVLVASRMSDRGLETLSAAACASTLSFVMFRAFALYPDFERWDYLLEAWESTRQITGQRTRILEGTSVARICTFIMQASGCHVNSVFTQNGQEIVDICKSLLQTPKRVPYGLSRIPYFDGAVAGMNGSREARVVAFEKFLGQVHGHPGSENDFVALAIGYLASRIAPGSIRHAGLLGPIVTQYPAALPWYGFCAGLGDEEAYAATASSRQGADMPGSARRTLRDILRFDPAYAAPTCDIGYLELIALARTGGDALGRLITTTPGSATVELIPGVVTTVNVPSKVPSDNQGGRIREPAALASLGRQIARLVETYKEVAGSETVPEVEQQQLLFSSRRKKK